MTTTYKIRFVHKVAPKPNEYHDRTADVPESADKRALAAMLRGVGAMYKGQRIREYRREVGRIVVFPACWRGITTTWHAIVLEAQP